MPIVLLTILLLRLAIINYVVGTIKTNNKSFVVGHNYIREVRVLGNYVIMFSTDYI